MTQKIPARLPAEYARQLFLASEGLVGKPNILQLRLFQIVEWCLRHRRPIRIIGVKPRKTGLSTACQAVLYWMSRTRPVQSMTMANFADTSEELQEIFKRFATNDQFPWESKFWVKNGRFHFSNDSRADTDTAHKDSVGRGFTYQVQHRSEVAHFAADGAFDARRVLLGATNSVARIPGTLVIDESTPNGAGGYFYGRYHGDPNEEDEGLREGAVSFEDFRAGKTGNGFVKLFAAWFEFDDYQRAVSEAEAERIAENLSEHEQFLVDAYDLSVEQIAWRREQVRECAGENQFLQEYPEDDVTCFLVSGNPKFSREGIGALQRLAVLQPSQYGNIVRVPADPTGRRVEWQLCPRGQGQGQALIRLWELPQRGARYLLAADTMTGAEQVKDSKKADRHSVWVLRAGWHDPKTRRFHPPATVARIVAPYQADSPVAVEHASLLALLYGDCLMAVEINNSGSYWNYELLNAGRTLYHRIQYDRERQTNRSVLGWQTNPTTRPIIVEHLAALLRASADPDQADAGCHIYCPHALQECLTFVVDPRGTPRAQDGCYDDDVMALAIGFFLVEACASVFGAPAG